jgi:hypothetical protein
VELSLASDNDFFTTLELTPKDLPEATGAAAGTFVALDSNRSMHSAKLPSRCFDVRVVVVTAKADSHSRPTESPVRTQMISNPAVAIDWDMNWQFRIGFHSNYWNCLLGDTSGIGSGFRWAEGFFGFKRLDDHELCLY